MVEQVDAADLKSVSERSAGSIPARSIPQIEVTMSFKNGDLVRHKTTGAIMLITTEAKNNFFGVKQIKGNLKGEDWVIACDSLTDM